MSHLKFATEHSIWTEEQWDFVNFSDESKFNLFGCNRRMLVRHRSKEGYSLQCAKSSVRFRGSMMVIVMIAAAGTGPLVKLHGKTNATVYHEIWKKHVSLNSRIVVNQPAVFMQYNAPCHTAMSVKNFFRMLLLWSGLLKAKT